MSNPVQVTKNKTRVLDPGAASAPMVVVYRGLGPETGKDYAYDTADWIIEQIKKAIPKESLEEVYRTEYRSLEDARASIGEFLEKIYNRERLHSALGYRPPQEFERHLRRAQAVRRG